MQADYVLEYDVLSLAEAQHLTLLVRVQAGPPPSGISRAPLNLSLVLDRSSSMIGEKLAYIKQAVQYLVQRLGGGDRVSIVTYNEAVQVVIPPTPAQHRDAIAQAVQTIFAMGTTNLSGGWLQGCTLVAEGQTDGAINRVLLLTDGLANEGITEPAQLAALARQKREEGVTTTALGVGMDFNEDLLRTLAEEGGGAFYFIDNPDQAPRLFAEELQDLMNVVGQNLVVTLTPSPQIDVVRQLNAYPTERRGESVQFRLGDLFADEVKMLVLELSIPAMQELGEVQVAELHFEYDELQADTVTHRTLTLPVVINSVAAKEAALHPPNADVIRSALLLQAARARENAIRHADGGDFDSASQVLAAAAEAIESAPVTDDSLQSQHDMLREEALDMELGAQRYDSLSRKAFSTKSTYTRRDARLDETVALHTRMKSSRPAVEREGPTPTEITWKRERFDLTGWDEVRIGRSVDNDIVVPQDKVSAQHCRIVRDGDALYLEDLNSTNGTFANGGRVDDRFRLTAGDILTVGTWLFMLRG